MSRVGRSHQAHAERRTEHERVEVGAILSIGNAGYLREQDVQHEKPGQEEPDEGRERVIDEQPAEQFLRRGVPDRGSNRGPRGSREAAEIAPGIPEGKCDSAQSHEGRVEPPQHRQHPTEQHEHDRGHQGQLHAEVRQRHLERVGERAGQEGSEVHACRCFDG